MCTLDSGFQAIPIECTVSKDSSRVSLGWVGSSAEN